MERKLRIPEEPESSDPNSIRVLIKLPNGKRLERRFLKSHSLQVKSFQSFFFFKKKTRPVSLVDLFRRVLFSWQMVLVIHNFYMRNLLGRAKRKKYRTFIYQIRSAACYTLSDKKRSNRKCKNSVTVTDSINLINGDK